MANLVKALMSDKSNVRVIKLHREDSFVALKIGD